MQRIRHENLPMNIGPYMGSKLVVVSGPSGVGKSTIVKHIRRIAPDIWISISMTTRLQRQGEVEGREYFFVSRESFVESVERGEMLEWAEFAGNLYGTPRQPVLDQLEQGRSVLLEIELQGARQVRDNYPEAHLAFIQPPTWDDLIERLQGRGSEDEVSIQARLEVAKSEILSTNEFDIVLTNHTVERTALELVEFARS